MITIKNIADKLGVSPSTVTRALADNPRISLETRRRIQRTAEKMGYVANAAADSYQLSTTSDGLNVIAFSDNGTTSSGYFGIYGLSSQVV